MSSRDSYVGECDDILALLDRTSPSSFSISKRSEAADIISDCWFGSDLRHVRKAITLAIIAMIMMKPAAPRTPPISASLLAGSDKVTVAETSSVVVDISIDPKVSDVDVVVVVVDVIVDPSLVKVLLFEPPTSVSLAVVDCVDVAVVVEFAVGLGV